MNSDTNRIRKAITKRLPPNKRLDPNVEHLIYLDYILFLERLGAEASECARKQNTNKIKESHVKEVTETVLQEFRG